MCVPKRSFGTRHETILRSRSFAACEVAWPNGGRYDVDMDSPDIYQDAALADITLICQQCKAILDSDDLAEGQPRFSDSGYFVALANEAYRRGWLIEYEGLNASYFDYRILCPECAGRKSE